MSDKNVRWLIVMTKPRAENRTAMRLRDQGFHVWFWHVMRDLPGVRRSETQRKCLAYFSRYLFVRETKRLKAIAETDGVTEIVSDGAEGDANRVAVTLPDAKLKKIAAELRVEETGNVRGPEKPVEPSIEAGELFRVVGHPTVGDVVLIARSAAPLDGSVKVHAYPEQQGRQVQVTVPRELVGDIVKVGT